MTESEAGPRLEILHLPGCLGARDLEARLREVVPGLRVHNREVRDADEAAAAGMTGSPTLLVDGVDPFAAAAGPSGPVACRIYRDAAGRLDGAPTTEALRAALGAVGIERRTGSDDGPGGA